MGCGSSKDEDISNPKKKVDKVEDFQISHQDLVGEKTGKITNDYSILNPPLGKGAFGEVRKAVHKVTNQQRAVKIISKKNTPKEEQERLKDEVEILKKLDHPNIIKVYEFYQDSRYFYIVTDLCTGGELFDKIIEEKSFSERKAAETLKQILSAVSYCHQNNIVHRDLKPENVLYESNKPGSVIKVVDFGTSRVFDPSMKMNQKIGTPYYIAPEVLDKKYDEKCDVWSCGVILYILLCGSPPFNGNDDYEILESVKRGQYQFNDDEWENVSQKAKELISKMLKKGQFNSLVKQLDPKERITVQAALNDSWISEYCKKQEVDIPQLQKSLQNMKTFRTQKKLQEAALIFMVNHLATKEEKNELLKQFQQLDANGDGRLSREELINGYQKILNQVQAEEEVDRIMKAVDKNNSGAIDYSEFVLATINREGLVEKERLEMAFKMFDRDGSGTITTEEIKTIFGGNALISDSVWQELIKEVDQNSDGQISYQEFKDMMLKISGGA